MPNLIPVSFMERTNSPFVWYCSGCQAVFSLERMAENPYQSPAVVPARRRRLFWPALFLCLAIVGGLGTAYFGWALHRISNRVIVHDDHWPRPAPYPDAWMTALNDWYDRRYPAPGFIKIHGELDRVWLTVLACFAIFFAVFAVGFAPLARQYEILSRARRILLKLTSGAKR